jgi:DNA-binding transcriptional MerR regulator
MVCADGMSWSTREIAELAGTSLRAVRHYHEVGLLPEPERRSNGYKKYGVPHLVRLLRIKRLVDLGFSLAQIAETVDDAEHPEHALRTLDAELADTIQRLQRARVELGTLLRRRVPADLPPELTPVTPMSSADRALVLVMTRIMGPRQLRAYGEMIRTLPAHPTDREFDDLPADTGEAARQDLAERMAPRLRLLRAAHPDLDVSHPDAPLGEESAREILATVVRELYNPAQLDVLGRVAALLSRPR